MASSKYSSNAVLVSGFPESTSKDKLTIYFQSQRRSGGGDVTGVLIRSNGEAVVQFSESSAASNVLQRGHEFGGEKLTVRHCLIEMEPDFEDSDISDSSSEDESLPLNVGTSDRPLNTVGIQHTEPKPSTQYDSNDDSDVERPPDSLCVQFLNTVNTRHADDIDGAGLNFVQQEEQSSKKKQQKRAEMIRRSQLMKDSSSTAEEPNKLRDAVDKKEGKGEEERMQERGAVGDAPMNVLDLVKVDGSEVVQNRLEVDGTQLNIGTDIISEDMRTSTGENDSCGWDILDYRPQTNDKLKMLTSVHGNELRPGSGVGDKVITVEKKDDGGNSDENRCGDKHHGLADECSDGKLSEMMSRIDDNIYMMPEVREEVSRNQQENVNNDEMVEEERMEYEESKQPQLAEKDSSADNIFTEKDEKTVVMEKMDDGLKQNGSEKAVEKSRQNFSQPPQAGDYYGDPLISSKYVQVVPPVEAAIEKRPGSFGIQNSSSSSSSSSDDDYNDREDVVSRKRHCDREEKSDGRSVVVSDQESRSASKEDSDEEEDVIDTIEVTNFSANTTGELLEMYFENRKKSGGGNVKKVEIASERAYITFEDPKVIDTVLQKTHLLNQCDLKVRIAPSLPPRDKRKVVVKV